MKCCSNLNIGGHLAHALLDVRGQADLTLLADAAHVAAEAGGEHPAEVAAHPRQHLVPRLGQVVQTDRALGELPPAPAHPWSLLKVESS